MVLAQRQKYRSMEQNRSPEINPRTYGTLSLTKEARIYNGEKTISLTSGAGKTGQPCKRMKLEQLSNTIHKNKLKMD